MISLAYSSSLRHEGELKNTNAVYASNNYNNNIIVNITKIIIITTRIMAVAFLET
jgi:hypothetical protein